MRVLIISFFTDWIAHLGTELELAQLHLDAGDQVDFLVCDGSIGGCRANPAGERLECEVCQYRRLRGIKALGGKVGLFRLGDYLDERMIAEADEVSSRVRTAEAAKELDFEGHDLGWGALSSTIQDLRDPLCADEIATARLNRFTRAAVLTYRGVGGFLKAEKGYRRAYIFNGRFACTRGAFRACQKAGGIEVALHERGSSPEKYVLFEGGLLHTRSAWRKRIEEAWNSEPDPERRKHFGSLFYEERRSGTPVAWKSFTTLQREGFLPEELDPQRVNIAIFNSSEDEFAAIGDEWRNHIYPMQNEGVARIVRDALDRYPDYHLFLRMHPNLLRVDNEDVRRIRQIRSENFHLIEPDSPISSYALLDAVDKVISFGSSVGIEATYWRKPSIMAGHSFYEHLGAVYCAESHEHLMSLLGEDLDPCPIEGAIKYGYYLRTFGEKFKYWEADGFDQGRFRGVPLRPVGKRLGRKLVLASERSFGHDAFPTKVVSGVANLYAWLRRAGK